MSDPRKPRVYGRCFHAFRDNRAVAVWEWCVDVAELHGPAVFCDWQAAITFALSCCS